MCGLLLLCEKLFNRNNNNTNPIINQNQEKKENDQNQKNKNDENDDLPPPYTEVVKNARLLDK